MANYHEMEMRVVYAQTLNELIERDPNVICLEADLGKASGTIPEVSKRHPEQLHQRRASPEANMIGIGAGLASEGKIPFCASFTAFATRRVLRPDHDQRGLREQQREDRRHRARASPRAPTAARTCASRTWPSCAPCRTCTSTARPTRTSCARSCATWPPASSRPTCS